MTFLGTRKAVTGSCWYTTVSQVLEWAQGFANGTGHTVVTGTPDMELFAEHRRGLAEEGEQSKGIRKPQTELSFLGQP